MNHQDSFTFMHTSTIPSKHKKDDLYTYNYDILKTQMNRWAAHKVNTKWNKRLEIYLVTISVPLNFKNHNALRI